MLCVGCRLSRGLAQTDNPEADGTIFSLFHCTYVCVCVDRLDRWYSVINYHAANPMFTVHLTTWSLSNKTALQKAYITLLGSLLRTNGSNDVCPTVSCCNVFNTGEVV